jgi:zinc transport system substrate-binding protein
MMKKILIALVLLSSVVYAKMDVAVSILPIQTFVQKIGGDKVNIALMVKPGNSPHTYEPKPSQMKQIAKAKLYFAIGVEFENVWLKKFHDVNKNMEIVHADEGIKKLPMAKHSHGDEEHGHDEHEDEHKGHKDHVHHDEHGHKAHNEHHEHDHHDEHHEHEKHEEHEEHKGLDPHVWTSPDNVKVIAKNIYHALVHEDIDNAKYYKTNYEKFLKEIHEVEHKIEHILKNSHDAKFMVFHPAWGYFATQFHLEQIAIESGGKNPKPKQLMHLIEEAKEEKVSAVFTAPEFSEKAAKQIAHEVGVPVIKVSPLNPKWGKNLIRLAKAIANK